VFRFVVTLPVVVVCTKTFYRLSITHNRCMGVAFPLVHLHAYQWVHAHLTMYYSICIVLWFALFLYHWNTWCVQKVSGQDWNKNLTNIDTKMLSYAIGCRQTFVNSRWRKFDFNQAKLGTGYFFVKSILDTGGKLFFFHVEWKVLSD
jgi:hypothetical protein